MSILNNKAPWLAASAAIVVGAACFIGNSPVMGIREANLVTARFSGLLFALALVAKTPRLNVAASRRAELMLAFVAAHGVHFASVLARAFFDHESGFHSLKPATFITFATGFGIIFVLAFTIRAASRAGRMAHSILTYVVWVLFAVAFGSGWRHPASAAMFGVTVLALVLRIALRPADAARSRAATTEQ